MCIRDRATVDQLTASFLGYLRSHVANEEDSRQNTLQSTTRKRTSAHFDPPESTSTPKGRPPSRKRPLIITERPAGSLQNDHSRARKSAMNIKSLCRYPRLSVVSEALLLKLINNYSVCLIQVETSQGEGHTVKKLYTVSSTLKKATMNLAKGNYHTFATYAMKIQQLKRQLLQLLLLRYVGNARVYVLCYLGKVHS